MKITALITEEAARFHTAYGIKARYVFIGRKESHEIDELVSDMRKLGLIANGTPVPHPIIDGMWIFDVDADSHLSFGFPQPSPCG